MNKEALQKIRQKILKGKLTLTRSGKRTRD